MKRKVRAEVEKVPPRAEPLLVEVSWETCNQLGGIYTVIRSKVPAMMEQWGNRYCLLGPYNEQSAAVEFEEATPTGAFGAAVKQLRDQGVNAHFGRWLVTGRPHAVLLDQRSVYGQLAEIKYQLWNDHKLSLPGNDGLVNDVVAFGELVRRFFMLLAQKESSRRSIVGHFHEWMAGTAIPNLRKDRFGGGIVFTTHATMLGRYLAPNNAYFYDHLPYFDAAAEANRYQIGTQHNIECAAAHGAHVLTTVSDVTARECEHLLHRKADVLLPNGLNIRRFAAIHEFQNLHRMFKEKIHQFTIGHFFPSYSFDLDKTLYFFTSGRYEYRNKGMDMTIEALSRLNHLLRESKTDINVVAFIITKADVRSMNVTALHSSSVRDEFGTTIDAIKEQIGERLFYAAARGNIPDFNTLIDDYWRLRLRRTIQAFKRDAPPLIVTHDLVNDATDPVLMHLRACHLFNHAHDPVKVVFHPQFITTTNPLFGMDYDDFVRGCHLGIFPSYYEPWGYTPLESIALGVPAITSDLSGFGSYLRQLLPDHAEKGMYVIRRYQRGFEQSVQQLADRLYLYCRLSRRQRIALRNSVEGFSDHFDWSNLGKCYHEAHALAMDRAGT